MSPHSVHHRCLACMNQVILVCTSDRCSGYILLYTVSTYLLYTLTPYTSVRVLVTSNLLIVLLL